MYLRYKSFENTLGKAIFPCLENFLSSLSNLKLLSANSFTLEKSKSCCLTKG